MNLGPPPALRASSATALFLDFDGTLVDIADHPDAVIVAPDLRPLLERLSDALDGRLAVITGRSIAALEALLGPAELAIAGSHGGEFRPAAKAAVEPLASALPDAVVARLHEVAHENGGLLVEPKPFSAAVHYRHHPEARDNLLDCARQLAAEFGLGIKHGKQVIELTMPGSDKGTAVSRFMALPAFRGTTPVFLGDDVTDEDAFIAVDRLGGHGILVGAQRPTAAAFRFEGVAQVHHWLHAALRTFQKGDFQA
ncbi:trehalose-phosphatase [Novosphingobium guangzhouense]|uniref:Trehalose 6-phosphate phosphatase n=1 Tax=Novosphingobium guangzhouense TaxID=1850347 RepID=A0A2K2FZE3_9SPHN|nr:trehalose-phosphatase [Novosphingobium guangzhouense]